MNVEMPSQKPCSCSHSVNTQHASNQQHAKESFSVVYSVVSINSYFNPWTGKDISAEQVSHQQDNSLQSVLQNLPDVRRFLKPWYFNDAHNQNVSYIRTTAVRIVSSQSEDQSEIFNAVFAALLEKHGFGDKKHACCEFSSEAPAVQFTESEPLSKGDKAQLEAMHHYAEAECIDTKHVNTVATQLAWDKSVAIKQGQSLPVFSGKYFEDEIAGMQVWKNTIHGEKIVEHLRSFFA